MSMFRKLTVVLEMIKVVVLEFQSAFAVLDAIGRALKTRVLDSLGQQGHPERTRFKIGSSRSRHQIMACKAFAKLPSSGSFKSGPAASLATWNRLVAFDREPYMYSCQALVKRK